MRVVVAGGGIAALEVLAGLHALAGERVAPTLVAPVTSFSFRPLSMAVPFTFRGERTRTLAELAGGLGARFVRDGLTQVDEGRSRILTHDGDFLSYDALVVAVGARTSRGEGAARIWTRGPEGNALFTHLLRDLESGAVQTVAFVVPRGAAWPVDAYELAFVASLAATRGERRAKVLLLTAEQTPLQAFGLAVGEAVADELTRAKIELVTGVEARAADAPDGRGNAEDEGALLHLTPGSALRVDRAVLLPVAHGPAIAGMPHDSRGFIPVDGHARVTGARHTFAAGDATSLSLKHSTLAASQATAAAEAIAAEAGADVTPTPWSPVLHGLLTFPPHFSGAPGSPWLNDGEPVTHCLWWPPGHVAGRRLAPYLAASDPGVRPGLGWHPNGLPVAVDVGGDERDVAGSPAAAASKEAMRGDARARQLMAIHRAEREGTQLVHELEGRRGELGRHQRETVEQLEAAGYLHHVSAPER
jgi:sulfide:quinone oxidoreductase